ncbi:hypothetical protein SKDZ_06G0500 [Saccharomyces kudriavzevii ZP591]|nr:hypothetical protein SKDZ_06G0500 [Saccharomyces kudriavzevii ZP591]
MCLTFFFSLLSTNYPLHPTYYNIPLMDASNILADAIFVTLWLFALALVARAKVRQHVVIATAGCHPHVTDPFFPFGPGRVRDSGGSRRFSVGLARPLFLCLSFPPPPFGSSLSPLQ